MPPAHHGYRPDEVPRYAECPYCKLGVRVDRTDLIAEHAQSCKGAEVTPRQAEVLRLMADGLTNAEIAVELRWSEETIKTEVQRLLRMFGAAHRAQLVMIALRRGLIW